MLHPSTDSDTWDGRFTDNFNAAVQEYIDEHLPGE